MHEAAKLLTQTRSLLQEVGSATHIDEALERALRPDEPQRSIDEWLATLSKGLSWVASDMALLHETTPGADAATVRHALRTLMPDEPDADASQLRALLHWRAQQGLVELAAHAVRAAATLADEAALEGLAR